MTAFYKCFLDKDRCVQGHFEAVLEEKTYIFQNTDSNSFFYYEGTIKEFFCKETKSYKFMPDGNGTMYNIFGIRIIVSGEFKTGKINGFVNVKNPEKKIEFDGNYINDKVDRNSPCIIYRPTGVQIYFI